MDITTLLNETLALKAAREDIVAKLNEDGFAADANTPLSEIANMMREDGACLTPRLVCFNTRRNTYHYFTRDEWEYAADNSNDFSYMLMLGMEIRAEGHRFILSGGMSGGLQWAANGNLNVPDVTSYGVDCLEIAVEDFDGFGNTTKIIAAGDNAGVNTAAADWARAYKTLKNRIAQTDDPLQWYMPAMGELLLLQKYKNVINNEITWFANNPKGIFTDYDLTTFAVGNVWSSTQVTASKAWYLPIALGVPAQYIKSSNCDVRPLAAIPTT